MLATLELLFESEIDPPEQCVILRGMLQSLYALRPKTEEGKDARLTRPWLATIRFFEEKYRLHNPPTMTTAAATATAAMSVTDCVLPLSTTRETDDEPQDRPSPRSARSTTHKDQQGAHMHSRGADGGEAQAPWRLERQDRQQPPKQQPPRLHLLGLQPPAGDPLALLAEAAASVEDTSPSTAEATRI